MKRHISVILVGLSILFALSACGKRQDSSARGSVYEARTYTTAGKTHKTGNTIAMTLSLSSDDKTQGVLSTATLSQPPYYRRYETVTRKVQGAKTTLTTTGEVTAMNFSKASDAKNGINPTTYSYSQKGDSKAVGTFTKTGAGLDLKLGKTVWHFTCTDKKTRFQLPYGIADQAKQAKVDKQN
ncbi:hypothetical protein [Lacticaseibacillus jixiensis]|uniref:hypothetical protein n=1 Tax=Lacticaseibacillus jixiensis TaxID=3231926 RepID=UPI0036F1ABBE